MFFPIDPATASAIHHDKVRRLSRHRITDVRSSRPRRRGEQG